MTENEKLALSLLEACRNRSNARELAFALNKEMDREHRTIQQNLMTVVKLLTERHAEREYDLRNEASVQWAQNAMEFPYI